MSPFSGHSRTELDKILNEYEARVSEPGAEDTSILRELPLHQVELELQHRDLVETQQALEEARDRYAELYDFAPVGYLSLERSGTIRNLNLTACTMLGKERASLVGMPFRSFLADRDQRPFFGLLQRAFASGKPVSGEFAFGVGDGRAVRLECQLHGDADGVQTCLTILTDITERKRNEEALQRENAFLQHLIDGIDDPIYVIAPDHKLLKMNAAGRAVADAAGLDPAHHTCHQVTHGSERPCDGDDHPCPLQTVLRTRRPTRVVHNHAAADGSMRRCEVAVSPLFDDAGNLLGLVEVNRDISDHVELLEALKVGDMRFEHLAKHDALTQLPNRELFADRLGQALKAADRRGAFVGVLFIDLDRFKEINDSFDHATGDKVLIDVAARLKGLFRNDDTVARMGGDEFTVILGRIEHAEDAGLVAQKIIRVFDGPFDVDNRQLRLGASIGISVYPQHGATVEELVRNADSAMYEAKAAGGMGFHYYSPELTRRALERIALESALGEALEKDQFVIHYQPQFRLDTDDVCGVEALMRWRHPELGLVGPDRFIRVAEDTGLITALDRQMIRRACAQMRAWVDSGLVRPGLPVSVNVSGRMFDSEELVTTVTEILADTGLPPASLELEVTESAMMRDVGQSARQLIALREHGVRIAIDDFGTGYSSLAYLKSLPITRLKIDRLFVSDSLEDANARGITRAIISLAGVLEIDLLAEGIETDAQRSFLLEHGCLSGQGFLFSRPLSAAGFERLMAGNMA